MHLGDFDAVRLTILASSPQFCHCHQTMNPLTMIRHEGNKPKARSGRDPVADIPDLADDDFYPVNEPINPQATR
jgi:hypothetical protein